MSTGIWLWSSTHSRSGEFPRGWYWISLKTTVLSARRVAGARRQIRSALRCKAELRPMRPFRLAPRTLPRGVGAIVNAERLPSEDGGRGIEWRCKEHEGCCFLEHGDQGRVGLPSGIRGYPREGRNPLRRHRRSGGERLRRAPCESRSRPRRGRVETQPARGRAPEAVPGRGLRAQRKRLESGVQPARSDPDGSQVPALR